MRMIAAALLMLACTPLAGMAQRLEEPPGMPPMDAVKINMAIRQATFAGFCEWRSLGWGRDYLLFLAGEIGARTTDPAAGGRFIIAAKDAAALEIQTGDLRGNCARRYNPAILAEMDRARGAGQIPSLIGVR